MVKKYLTSTNYKGYIDTTFIASVFSGSLAGFGIAAAKNGNLNGQKKKEENPPVKSAIDPKEK